MTRKDFEMIARTLKDARHGSNDEVINNLARKFAAELSSTNPRFDRTRFLAACGVEAA